MNRVGNLVKSQVDSIDSVLAATKNHSCNTSIVAIFPKATHWMAKKIGRVFLTVSNWAEVCNNYCISSGGNCNLACHKQTNLNEINVQLLFINGIMHSSINYPYLPPQKGFSYLPPPSGNFNKASYICLKFLAFETPPTPNPNFQSLLWGSMDIFWNHANECPSFNMVCSHRWGGISTALPFSQFGLHTYTKDFTWNRGCKCHHLVHCLKKLLQDFQQFYSLSWYFEELGQFTPQSYLGRFLLKLL